ncbi:MAG: hypothetical protein NC223_06095 [Butyrivibrio sp.]|nr:hypothetical protein [Butyrivibrio sp.]
MAGRRQNIDKFRRKPTLNIGIIIFGVIFIYLVISVIIYASSEKTVIYEVYDGSLAVDRSFTGFIAREERIVEASYSGTANYFLKNNHRAGKNTIIYSVDETGRVAERIKEESSDEFSEDGLMKIRDQLFSLTKSYDGSDFSEVYAAADSISGSIFELRSDSIVENLDEFAKETDNLDFFHKATAPESGLVVYYADGYENFNESGLRSELFDASEYTSRNLQADSIINAGDPAYKLITSDVWYIYIQLDETQAARLAEAGTVRLRFPDENIECSAGLEIISVGGVSYGKIKMTKYLPNFSVRRHVVLELEQQAASGLKIPASSIFRKNSYAIPRRCMSDSGALVLTRYDSSGNEYLDSVIPTIYYSDSDNYYVSMNDLQSGQMLKIADSREIFTVGIIRELDGVYCVNRGYAVFKAVTIIDKNDEYCIIEKGTDYGLATYDHIVLDYKTVKESELIE